MVKTPPAPQALVISMHDAASGHASYRLENEAWPQVAIIGPIDDSHGIVRHLGDVIRIELANGWAQYRPEQHLPGQGWRCVLEDHHLAKSAAEQGVDPARGT